MMNIKILDCTLRDGGYYTDWDFNDELLSKYIRCINLLPIDYIEVGYRNRPQASYLGRMGYSPLSVLKKIRTECSKKISVMLNEKDVLPEHLQDLIFPVKEYIDMVRLAVDPKNFNRALVLAKAIKDCGLEVGFNVMYMSTWHDRKDFFSLVEKVNSCADLFCMVDSFGGIMPDEVIDITSKIKTNVYCKIGFHGHDNLEMGLANTLAAIESGVDMVDSTVLGMGRGAGNLKTELLLTILSKKDLEVDFNVLGELVATIQPLKDKFKWGTNLPYMLSGAFSIPQKDVMGWICNPAYSFNSIVRALDNRRHNLKDNAQYPALEGEIEECIIIGGGKSVQDHHLALKEFLSSRPDMAIVYGTSRYISYFKDFPNPKYYILTGNEAKRLADNIGNSEFSGSCILAPYPRMMGTDVPEIANDSTFELSEMNFSENYSNSCTALALETAMALDAKTIYIVGYDGYKGEILSEKESSLTNENRTLFREFLNNSKRELISLTPTLYSDLKIKSIYSLI